MGGSGDAAGFGGGRLFEFLRPEPAGACRYHPAALGPHRAAWPHPLLTPVFTLSGSVSEAGQFWDLSRLWTLRGRGIDADGVEFGGICQAGQPQPDQHGHLSSSHSCLARLFALAQSRARGRHQPFADPAVGTGLGRSSTTGTFRFADPDVRRHGGARVFAQLESGVRGRSYPAQQPWLSTQSQFRGCRFQDPIIASIYPKTAPRKNLVKRNLWRFASLLPEPLPKRFRFKP